MVTVAVVTSPNSDDAPDCVPRRVFEEAPGAEIELESLVPLGRRAVPYVWVWGDDLGPFDRALRGCPEVADAEVVEDVDGGALYRVEWDVDSPVIRCIERADGTLRDAYGTAEEWELTIWFEEGEDATAFQQCCRERGVPLEVARIRATADGREDGDEPVTQPQREALEAAYASGYFERPRGATQEDIAEQLGISAAAAGNRLRRGTANMVETLLDDR